MVFIYWALINQTKNPTEETSSQEIPAANIEVYQEKGDSFFPKADPPEDAESIKEETFIESP